MIGDSQLCAMCLKTAAAERPEDRDHLAGAAPTSPQRKHFDGRYLLQLSASLLDEGIRGNCRVQNVVRFRVLGRSSGLAVVLFVNEAILLPWCLYFELQ